MRLLPAWGWPACSGQALVISAAPAQRRPLPCLCPWPQSAEARASGGTVEKGGFASRAQASALAGWGSGMVARGARCALHAVTRGSTLWVVPQAPARRSPVTAPPPRLSRSQSAAAHNAAAATAAEDYGSDDD